MLEGGRTPCALLYISARFSRIPRSLNNPSELPYEDGGGRMSTPDTESRGCTLSSGLINSPPDTGSGRCCSSGTDCVRRMSARRKSLRSVRGTFRGATDPPCSGGVSCLGRWFRAAGMGIEVTVGADRGGVRGGGGNGGGTSGIASTDRRLAASLLFRRTTRLSSVSSLLIRSFSTLIISFSACNCVDRELATLVR